MARLLLEKILDKKEYEEINVSDIDLEYNKETKNGCVVISDGLDGTAYILNKDGIVVKEDECGFNSWCTIIVASEYLSTYERYGDEDHFIALEKLNEHHKE